MIELQNRYKLISELGKLKLVFRNTKTSLQRNESTAEHSWSVSMIIMIMMQDLKREFKEIDELKTIKMALIHDLVEMYAGDVNAFDLEARKKQEVEEIEALEKLIAIEPVFGKQLHALWYEFEAKESLEAKIAKAADSICPIFQRLHSKQSYRPFAISLEKLEATKAHLFAFSQTFSTLFQQLKEDLLREGLI